jgi:hypothetical protein
MITAQLDELYTPGTGFSRRARVRRGLEVVGEAAKLTVDQSGTPRFAKWKPRPGNLE